MNKENSKLIVKYIDAIVDNYKDAGALTKKYLSDAINALIAGKNPGSDFTKAIGCSVTRKKTD